MRTRSGLEGVVALIPARGGSKRLSNKNLHHVAGKPLVAYTFDAALKSSHLDRILLSTDSPDLVEFGLSQGIEVPFLRPSHIASDTAEMIDVVRHALKFLEADRAVPKLLVLLQPTSPLRTSDDIDISIQMATDTVDSVVSIHELPSSHHPEEVFLQESGGLLTNPLGKKKIVRSGPMYARNGPAVLVTRPRVIESGSLYGQAIRGYVMPASRSIDINTLDDMLIAEALLTSLK